MLTVKSSLRRFIGDVSSISGSDSESNEEAISNRNAGEDNPLMTLSLLKNETEGSQQDFTMDKSNPKIHFVNNLGNYMSVYREVLFASKVNIVRNLHLINVDFNICLVWDFH